jgi:hypothetical protein
VAEGSPDGAALLEETRTAMGKAPASSAAFPTSAGRRAPVKIQLFASPWDFRHLTKLNLRKFKNGEMQKARQYADRHVAQTYGPHFAKGCADDEKLSDVLHKLDEPSLSALVEDHEAGTLEAGECVDAELNPPRLPYRCPLLYGPRRTGFCSASGRGRAEALVLPEWLLRLLKHVKARQPDIRQIPFTETL